MAKSAISLVVAATARADRHHSESGDAMDSQQVDQPVASTAAEPEVGDDATSTPGLTVETLIEEVSIDGMCGVY
jgi:mycofactocin precursor